MALECHEERSKLASPLRFLAPPPIPIPLVIIDTPPIPLPPLLLLGLAVARGVHPPTRNAVGGAETHSRGADDAAGRELAAAHGCGRIAAAGGEEHVEPAPRGGHTRAVDGEPGYVEVAAKHEQRGEEHR